MAQMPVRIKDVLKSDNTEFVHDLTTRLARQDKYPVKLEQTCGLAREANQQALPKNRNLRRSRAMRMHVQVQSAGQRRQQVILHTLKARGRVTEG
eukprot:5513319-Amphidinium_carterae.2